MMDEEGKATPAPVRVKQAYIDLLLKQFPALKSFGGVPEELIETMAPTGERELFRAFMAQVVAFMKASRGKDEAILEQCHAQGYAEEEVEDEDGDGDKENDVADRSN